MHAYMLKMNRAMSGMGNESTQGEYIYLKNIRNEIICHLHKSGLTQKIVQNGKQAVYLKNILYVYGFH